MAPPCLVFLTVPYGLLEYGVMFHSGASRLVIPVDLPSTSTSTSTSITTSVVETIRSSSSRVVREVGEPLLSSTSTSTSTSSGAVAAAEGLVAWRWSTSHMLINASLAFALNVAVFLFVGRTNAIAMNLCGIVKDWGLILLSWALFGDSITWTMLAGYGIAFAGLTYWNRDVLWPNQEQPRRRGGGEGGGGGSP